MQLRTLLFTTMVSALLASAPVDAKHHALTAALTNPTASLRVDPGVLTTGGNATISYSNPAMAGKRIVIKIDNGMHQNTQTTIVEITLDANGNGSTNWPVPNWNGANFNAPDVPEVNCPIL